jgi:hypothetical protein
MSPRPTLLALAAALLVLAAGAGPASAHARPGDGPSWRERVVNIRACVKVPGWAALRTQDGRAFRNAGQCVRYAARGGAFGSAEPPPPPPPPPPGNAWAQECARVGGTFSQEPSGEAGVEYRCVPVSIEDFNAPGGLDAICSALPDLALSFWALESGGGVAACRRTG